MRMCVFQRNAHFDITSRPFSLPPSLLPFLPWQVGDRSSEFYPEINEVRTEGSYIYEEFVETQGTDVKVRLFSPLLVCSTPFPSSSLPVTLPV